MESDSPQIKAIRARYKAGFTEKAIMVEKFALELSENHPKGLQERHRLFRDELHKLAGSSGMYGYHDVCDLCRRAMYCIDNDQITELMIVSSQLHKLLTTHSEG